MRRELMAAVVVVGLWAAPLQAEKRHEASCVAIRKAVWAGRTLEQITADYDTDAARVMKCVQKKGRRRKELKAAKKPAKHSAKPRKEKAKARSKPDTPPRARQSSSVRAVH